MFLWVSSWTFMFVITKMFLRVSSWKFMFVITKNESVDFCFANVRIWRNVREIIFVLCNFYFLPIHILYIYTCTAQEVYQHETCFALLKIPRKNSSILNGRTALQRRKIFTAVLEPHCQSCKMSYFLFTIFQNVNIRTHDAVFAQIDMLTIELRPQKNLHAVQDQLFCFLFVL